MGKHDPLVVILLERRAKSNATKTQTGWACDRSGHYRHAYYPVSQRRQWFGPDGACNKSEVVAHFRRTLEEET